MIRVLWIPTVALAAMACAWAVTLANANALGTISVTPSQGSIGTELTIVGESFEPGETIYLEIYPVGASSPYRIGNVMTDSAGGFLASAPLGNVYPGLDVPEPAPPGEGQQVNLAPGDYLIMAYPASYGTRTPETIQQAPKVSFEVTASSLPDTGGPPVAAGGALPASVIVGVLLLAVGILTWRAAIVQPQRE